MKEYSNDEITVRWDKKKCIHSGECVKCLPGVFDPDWSPWVKMDAASTEEITNAIDKCPSGALSYVKKTKAEKSEPKSEPAATIRAMKDGPLTVQGRCLLIDEDGSILAEEGPFALCRCGKSEKKPYCDGSHKKA